MSSDDWQIIIPKEATNLIKNPIAGGTSSFSSTGSATVTRDTSTQLWGLYCYKIVASTTNEGIQFTLSEALVNGSKYNFTVWVDTTTGDTPALRLNNGTDTQALSSVATHGDWTLFWAELSNSSTSTTLNLESTSGTPTYYIDGVQLELLAVSGDPYTTTIHGDLPGNYQWLGEKHNSASKRGALEHSGGIPKPLGEGTAPQTGFGMIIDREAGTGAAPITVNAQPQALIDGDLTTGVNVLPRMMSLGGRFNPTSKNDWHDKRRALVRALNNRFASVADQHRPRRLRYTGNTDYLPIEIDVYYESGLEGAASIDAETSNKISVEDLEVRLKASDPFFKAAGEQAVALNSRATHVYTKYSVRKGDVWGEYDSGGALNSHQSDSVGTDSEFDRCAAKKTELAIGISNEFFDVGTQYRPYVFTFDIEDESWTDITSGLTTTGFANQELIGNLFYRQNGNLILTEAGVDAAEIFEWDDSSWTSLGAANSGTAYLYHAFEGRDGNIYVLGNFTSIGGTSTVDSGYYDGSSWVAMSGLAGVAAHAGEQAPNGDIYIYYNTTGSTYRLNQWDGSSWTNLANTFTSVSDSRASVLIDDAGTVYLFGAFTTYNGTTVNRAARYNGVEIEELGAGLNGAVTKAIWHDEQRTRILLVGSFTATGDSAINLPGAAIWTGSEYVPFEGVELASVKDIDINDNGELVTVFEAAGGTIQAADLTTVTYAGTERSYPRIEINRSGGVTAKLRYLENNTTEAQIWIDHAIADGETVTLEFSPNRLNFTSDYYGNLWSRMLTPSNNGDLFLVPGPDGSFDNEIALLVTITGSPTITATMYYRDTYNGTD